jgi:hypothetical protein
MELEANKNFLIFPKLESKHIYILIFVISTFLRTLIPNLIEFKDFGMVFHGDKVYYKEICYFDMLTNFISDISVGIYKVITLFKEKEKTNKITTSEGIKTKQNMLRFFFQILPLIALIDTCAQLCLYVFSYIDPNGIILGIRKKNENEEDKPIIINEYDLFFIVGIDILFRYIFSRIILNSYFYRHHYLSMALNAIGFVPLIIINMKDLVINYDNAEKNDNSNEVKFSIFITYIILYIIRTILYSLEDVYNKKALNKLLLRPYELMLYKAFFQIIPIIIISTISINAPNFSYYIDNNLKSHYDDDDKEHHHPKLIGRLLYRFFFIVCNIFRTISLITIIEKINPNSLSILKSLEFISFFLYLTFKEKMWRDPINIIFEFISCIILLLGALIHNEIIIINKWKFYECTDYYKSEIKSFSNIDITNSEEKNSRAQESLISESNSQEVD